MDRHIGILIATVTSTMFGQVNSSDVIGVRLWDRSQSNAIISAENLRVSQLAAAERAIVSRDDFVRGNGSSEKT